MTRSDLPTASGPTATTRGGSGVAAHRHRLRLAGAGCLLVLGLAACSGSGSDSAASGDRAEAQQYQSSSGAAKAASGAAGGAADKAAAGRQAGAGSDPAQAVVSQQLLARTANLSLRVKDLAKAAGDVRTTATALGGLVTSENLQVTAFGDAPDARDMSGTITIAVPNAQLDIALDRLGKLGEVVDRKIASEDVTTQVVDTDARLKTQRESVARVRALMQRAIKLTDVVALESELSQRQADLEALESQLASLKDRVAMAPVVVVLSSTSEPEPTVPATGFLAGLRNGWDAFVSATTMLLTILGALLPFAILAALLGVPAWVLWRRRRTNRSASAPLAVPGPPPAAPAQP